MNRRAFLLAGGGALATVPGYARLLEPGWLEVTRTDIPLPGLRRRLRLLHLSDLHAGDHTPFEVVEEAISLGLAERPDFACLTGDFITYGALSEPGRYQTVLQALTRRVATYACFGNHDGGPWARSRGGMERLDQVRRMLEAAGVVCLRNRAVAAGTADAQVNLVGLGDLWSGDALPKQAFVQRTDPSLPTVLLAHNPDLTTSVGQYPWQLELCGHTHGGQIVVPVLGPPYVPINDFRFLKGLCRWRDRLVFVTRGVGAIHGMRFNCRPEVSILDLVPA